MFVVGRRIVGDYTIVVVIIIGGTSGAAFANG